MTLGSHTILKLIVMLGLSILSIPFGLWLMGAFERWQVPGDRSAAILLFVLLALAISDLLTSFVENRLGQRRR